MRDLICTSVTASDPQRCDTDLIM